VFRTRKKLILASGSPRRKTLLAELGINFTVVTSAADESRRPGEAPPDYVLRMASVKGERVARAFPGAWVLSADTIVIAGDHLLMKPRSEDEAVDMLMELSGQEHQVRTGYCLRCMDEDTCIVTSVLSLVRFRAFQIDWARAYAATGEPLDKAGAYGIQGRGGVLVESISGSYSNVVGLPLAEVISLLSELRVLEPMV